MGDDSDLKGRVQGAPILERVWGVPKKSKTTDGSPNRGRSRRQTSDRQKREIMGEVECGEELEDLGYGAHATQKKKNGQVDIII